MKQLEKRARKTFKLQQDESDCGVASLVSILRFHGGMISFEQLREWSGTTSHGTTMLGLLHASEKCGFNAEAFEGDIEALRSHDSPCILHVVKHRVLEHFIVCYSFSNGKFLIGDPETGIDLVSEDYLAEIWKSGALLHLDPSPKLVNHHPERRFEWIRGVLTKDQNLMISVFLSGIIISFLNFSTAIFTDKLVDNLLPSGDGLKIVLGVSAWIFLLGIKTLFGYVRDMALIKQAYLLNMRIVSQFITKLTSIPKSFFDRRKKGDLIARLFDTERIQTSAGMVLSQDLIDVLNLIAAVVIISFYESTIALFLILVILAYFLITRNYYTALYSGNKHLMASFAKNEASFVDNVGEAETVKSFNKENAIRNFLVKGFSEYQNLVVQVSKISINFKLLNDLFGVLSTLFVLIYCVNSVLNGTFQTGDLLAIFSIASIALLSTNRLAFATTHLQETRAAFERTNDILQVEDEIKPGQEITNINLISFKEVSFGFPGNVLLFENVFLDIPANEITILKGENGSGKSTILQLLQKFYSPVDGAILIDQCAIETIETTSLRALIGVVPQQIKIFNETLAYNISIDHQADLISIESFCDSMGFMSFFSSFSNGLKTILGEDGVKASGGQKQLIALARALYKRPKYLFLDEFNSSMDKDTEAFAIDLLKRLKSTMGIMIITHDEKLESYADQLYVIKNRTIRTHNFLPGSSLTQG